jgi:iron complex transport system permease protein
VQLAGLGRRSGSAATLLLVGIALNAFCGAIISAVIANAPDGDAARSAVFWLNGDLSGRTMSDVALAAGPVLLGAAVIVACCRQLDMLDLGEDLARAGGVEVRRVTHLVLAAAALTTAAAVSITGIISFVGLVVPHLVRLLTGPRHTILLPASFLLGGVFLTVADTAARMLFNPVVLQTGTITALIGAPFLLVLVLRRRRIAR